MHKSWFVAIAITGGMLVAAQAGMNNRLRVATGDPLVAVFVSFVVGTALLGALLVARGQALQDLASASDWLPRLPWWGLLGGTCGVGYVMSTVIGVPRIGVAMCIACVVLGQQVGAMLMDHYGWMGLTPTAFDTRRLLAVACMLAGVWFMHKG